MALITLGAAALYLAMRALPTGTNLSHGDFRVERGGIELCDPANPQFIPVAAVRSPVSMTVATDGPARAGGRVRCALALTTASGKPIGPRDLIEAHTRLLHLLVVDPSLEDYQHVHPEPAERDDSGREGGWKFEFTPRREGVYRIFGDFIPAATGRGLYASADLEVADAGDGGGHTPTEAIQPELGPPRTDLGEGGEMRVERDGFVFELTPRKAPVRAREEAELVFRVSRADGGAAELRPVMGAPAHLVAFDEARSGFAHLHPMDAGVTTPERGLVFKITIPQRGRYVVWAQVNTGGAEDVFAPFEMEVR
ncbi:hypothetical protein OH491_21945 [Termitidicoccus mucosus]|uniref:type II toxin-antitoxin system VapC family toxin n=1 Tax=Termitidicoccus mucosus TaxID=1184151 RepID=UPI0011AB7FD7